MTFKLNKSALSVLAQVINASKTDSGFEYVVENAPAVKVLIEAGLIEVNPTPEGLNEAGERQARPTTAGVEYAATGEFVAASADLNDTGAAGSGTDAKAVKAKPVLTIAKGIAIPGRTRAPSAAKYPFEDMQIGDSFFIADSEVTNGDAYKTLTSTISGTNLRYSEATGETRPNRKDASKTVEVRRPLRQYEHRRWTEEDGTKGTRIWRTEVDTSGEDNSEE